MTLSVKYADNRSSMALKQVGATYGKISLADDKWLEVYI